MYTIHTPECTHVHISTHMRAHTQRENKRATILAPGSTGDKALSSKFKFLPSIFRPWDGSRDLNAILAERGRVKESVDLRS